VGSVKGYYKQCPKKRGGNPELASRGNRQPETQRRSISGNRYFTRCREPMQAGKTRRKENFMDRKQARQEIRQRAKATAYLKKSKSGLYICPFCGSGTGIHATGALKYYQKTNTFTCFSCHKSGDVFDLFMHETGTDYNTALQTLAAEIGVTIDPYRQTAPYGRIEGPQSDFIGQGNKSIFQAAKSQQKAPQEPQEAIPDFTGYYNQCRKQLNEPAAISYLMARGISPETATAYWIGFDPQADPAAAPGGNGDIKHPCPRIIIPTTTAHYIGRSIDPATDKAFAKMNNKGGKPGIFNRRALYAQEVQVVFVCEGVFDALSVIEAGSVAIALNSTSNADALIKQLEQRPTAAILILCLDNDDAGRKAAQTIRQGLDRLNISHVTADICGGKKDPNEALIADKAAFCEAVERAQRQTAAKPDNTAFYIDSFMAGEIEAFKTNIKTGFANLDSQTSGLYAGLYCIAAISSLGKTTFAAQIADQIAAGGQDVLFFSLEQSRLEMVSKSLARITAKNDLETAVTSLSIRKGYLPRQVLDAAAQYKQEVQDRISIIEGNFNCNISFIGDYVRQYIRRNGVKPVVFIDYLQILQGEPQERRQTVKETVDSSVTELKRISRENGLTVFIISSVNRANYLTPIDFESLKESGGIEYTCDVIWGLQLQCLHDPIFDKQNNIKERRAKIKEAKAAMSRKIELCCLKNRYGIANFSVFFDYYPANDLFTPCNETELDFTPQKPGKAVYQSPRRRL